MGWLNFKVQIYPILNSFGPRTVNALRPKQNGRHFADNIFKYIFLNENA